MQHTISSSPCLPFCITAHYKALLEKAAQSDTERKPCGDYCALYTQITPSPLEQICLEQELGDPLGAQLYRITPRLVHQYKNRVLLLTSGICFAYCRHCFRRNYTSRTEGFITIDELNDVCLYLEQHSEVDEILVSGGDPLTATDMQLEMLFSKLRTARPRILIRLCTRAPIFLPQRFTDELIAILHRYKPMWLIPHINHCAEISDETEKVFENILKAGIAIQSQTVLLKNVNDSTSVLVRLFKQLVSLGVKPGYLFQCDLAQGTSHLRVSIEKGLELYAELKKELSGLSLPIYAVDLPAGGGKYNLGTMLKNSNPSVQKENDRYIFTDNYTGSQWIYPIE